MPSQTSLRQLPSKRCGCPRCREKYPEPDRPATKGCSASWQARWYDAAGKRQSLTRRRKDDAKKAMDLARGEIAAGTWIDPKRGKISVGEWRKLFLAGRNVGDGTSARDDSHWNAWVSRRWAGEPLNAISYMDVQTWVSGTLEPKLESASVHKVLNVLDQLLAAALRDRRIPYNPCDGIKVKPARKKHASQTRPPSMEQIQAACRQIPNPRYRQLPLLILETGLRWEEAAGLPPEAIDLSEQLLDVLQVLEEVKGVRRLRPYPKSDAGFRTVPLTVAACRLIEMQYKAQPPVPGEPIFRGDRGSYLSRNNYRSRVWLPATIAAGIHRQELFASGRAEHWPTVHDIRHRYASRLEHAGLAESIRKELLGHEKPGDDVTWRYTHGADDVKWMILAALGDEPPAEQREKAEPVRRLRLVV